VQYDVTAEVKNGLWGLWQILGSLGDRGGFQLWPVDGLAAGQERELEADLPVEAVEKVEAEVAAGMA
jgi:hypothetical protein